MKQTWLFNLLLLLALPTLVFAQSDSTLNKPIHWVSSIYLDSYYGYHFSNPNNNEAVAFFYNHNRHNEFNLNLGLLKINVSDEKFRANFALQTGTYANDNYSAEEGVIKNIFEANVGVALNQKKNLWLDVGIMPSHIGFESAISADNWTLSRSVLAENSPYFLSGAKLSLIPNDKLQIAVLVVNGWQRIQRVAGNSLPSLGTQVNYTVNQNINFNWSSFLGTDDPDSTRRYRFFNNFYSTIKANDRLSFITGFDYGLQQISKESSNWNTWFSPVIIAKYKISEKWSAAYRIEQYVDRSSVIITVPTGKAVDILGISLNLDYAPNELILCRLEGRFLNNSTGILQTKSGVATNNFYILSSIAFRFNKVH